MVPVVVPAVVPVVVLVVVPVVVVLVAIVDYASPAALERSLALDRSPAN